jgi:Flp pilus assembly protein TadG
VAAEAAVVIPLLLSLVLASVWCIALAATKVRVVDAAREAARVAARGESDDEAVVHGRRVAPDGTRFSVRRAGGQVVVKASVGVHGPGGLLAFLPALTVESEAVAAEEPR